MNAPDELRDGSRAAGWLNKLLAFVKMTRLVEGVGYRLIQTTRGTALEIQPGKGGGEASTGTVQMRVTAINSDTLSCVRWSQSAAGGSLNLSPPQETIDALPVELVAKPWRLRKTPFEGKTVTIPLEYLPLSIRVTYTYDPAFSTARRASIVGTPTFERQYIVPRYVVGDVIYVSEADSTGIDGVTKFDINADGRCWAAKYE